MKSFKMYNSVLLISIFISIYGLFPCIEYTTCQNRTATYLDGTEVDVAGYCNITGTIVEFGQIYDLSECQSQPASMYQLKGCTGNYLSPYPVPF